MLDVCTRPVAVVMMGCLITPPPIFTATVPQLAAHGLGAGSATTRRAPKVEPALAKMVFKMQRVSS